MAILLLNETQYTNTETGETKDLHHDEGEIQTPLDRFLSMRLEYLELDKKRRELKSMMDKEEILAIEYMKDRGCTEIEMQEMTISLHEKVKEAIKIDVKKQATMPDQDDVLEGQISLAEMREMQSRKGQEAAENQGLSGLTASDLLDHEDTDSYTESDVVTLDNDIDEPSDEVLRKLSDDLLQDLKQEATDGSI